MKNFYLILTLSIVAIIFVFSSQPASTSTGISRPIADAVANAIPQPDSENKTQEEKDLYQSNIHTFIRKGSHFSSFLLLGISAGMWSGYFKSKRKFIMAFVGCALYGVLDETRQLFVAGRSFEVTDMLIDASGALIGVCIAVLIWKQINKRKLKNA